MSGEMNEGWSEEENSHDERNRLPVVSLRIPVPVRRGGPREVSNRLAYAISSLLPPSLTLRSFHSLRGGRSEERAKRPIRTSDERRVREPRKRK